MKCQSLIIVATVIIISAVAFAGCVENGTFEPTPTPTPVVSPTGTSTVAPTTTPTPTVTPTTTPTPTDGDYRVKVSLSKMMEDITITYLGGPGSESVKGITITKVGSVTNVPYVLCEGICPVGESVTFMDTGIPGSWKDEDVIVTATFEDGATLIIYPPPPSTPSWRDGYMVMVTASRRGNDIEVMYLGGPDAELVVGITIVKAGSATNVPYVLCEGTCPVGDLATFTNAATPDFRNNHVIVTATFEDGATIVVLDTWV